MYGYRSSALPRKSGAERDGASRAEESGVPVIAGMGWDAWMHLSSLWRLYWGAELVISWDKNSRLYLRTSGMSSSTVGPI
jgi:hypothetical protein